MKVWGKGGRVPPTIGQRAILVPSYPSPHQGHRVGRQCGLASHPPVWLLFPIQGTFAEGPGVGGEQVTKPSRSTGASWALPVSSDEHLVPKGA